MFNDMFYVYCFFIRAFYLFYLSFVLCLDISCHILYIPRDSKRPKISMPLGRNRVFSNCAVLVLLDAFGAVLGKSILYHTLVYYTIYTILYLN